jgi:hypothetical protein
MMIVVVVVLMMMVVMVMMVMMVAVVMMVVVRVGDRDAGEANRQKSGDKEALEHAKRSWV